MRDKLKKLRPLVAASVVICGCSQGVAQDVPLQVDAPSPEPVPQEFCKAFVRWSEIADPASASEVQKVYWADMAAEAIAIADPGAVEAYKILERLWNEAVELYAGAARETDRLVGERIQAMSEESAQRQERLTESYLDASGTGYGDYSALLEEISNSGAPEVSDLMPDLTEVGEMQRDADSKFNGGVLRMSGHC